MAKYHIRYGDFQAQANTLRSIRKDLSKFENRLVSIANGMDDRDSTMALLKMKVKNSGRNIPEMTFAIDSIVGTVVKITDTYLKAEKANYNSIDGTCTFFHKLFTVNNLIESIGKAGFLGSALSFVLKPFANWYEEGVFGFSSDKGGVGAAKTIKSTYSFIKGLWEWNDSNKKLKKLSRMLPDRAKSTAIKRLIGLNDAMKGGASKAGTWWKRFSTNFKKVASEELDELKPKNGSKAFAKWGGIVLDGVVNAFENAEEAKSGEISAHRAVAETVVETAVDFGKNFVIGAAVTAGIAATVGSAPVLAVGAATLVVSTAIDYGIEKITGKDATEFVSDIIVDVGEDIGNAIEKGVDAAKDTFNNVVNCFTNPKGPIRGLWGAVFGY